jgi:hypothetical protein
MPVRFRVAAVVSVVLLAGAFLTQGGPGRAYRLAAGLIDPRKPNSDFFQNWAAAVDHRAGRSVYLPLDTRFDADFAPLLGDVYPADRPAPHWERPGPAAGNVLQINAHPPFATLLTLWAGYLPYSRAHAAWGLANVGLLLLAGGLIVGGAPAAVPTRARDAIAVGLGAFALGSEPLRAQFAEGNWNGLLLLLLAGAWRLDRAGRPGWAGVLVGVAALVKLYPGLLVAAFVLWRRPAGVAGFVLALVLGTLLTLAVFGWGPHREFATAVIPRIKMQQYPQNQSLAATAGRLFEPVRADVEPLAASPGLVKVATAATAGLMLLPLAWRALRRRPFDGDGLFAALAAAALPLSPVLWPHGLVQTALPAWGVVTAAVARRSAGLLLAAAVAAVLMSLDPAAVWAAAHPAGEPWRPWETVTVLAFPLWGVLVLYAAATRVAVRPGERGA